MFESFDVDLLDTISGCLYYLIILYHVSFFIVTHTSCKEPKLPYLNHLDEVLIGNLKAITPLTTLLVTPHKKDGVRFF